MIKICIIGAAGRMGQAIIGQISDAFELVGAVEMDGLPCIGQIALNDVPYTSDATAAATPCDVIIDFSTSQSVLNIIAVAAKLNKPLVCGVTGVSAETMSALAQAALQIPILYDSNMSPGVAALKGALRVLATALDYDAEIFEAHHATKADIPSGTALALANVIIQSRGRGAIRHNVPRTSGFDVGISSARGGHTTGMHTVLLLGNDESIEITHRAWSRDAYAKGALRAADFVVRQPHGLFSAADL
jgi:4-hydroxy-tetrahydrodipicolinate reductase